MLKVWNGFFLVLFIVTFSTSGANFTQETKTATNQFSLDLLKRVLHNNTDNSVVSPVSIYVLLAILQQGALGNTRYEVDNVVHAQPEVTKQAYNSLIDTYKGSFHRTELQMHTRAFAGEGLTFKSEFKQSLVNDFRSDIESVNFADSVNTSAHINSWISEATHHRINNLIQPEDLDALTRLVLVNAIYFKSFWENPFHGTENKAFRLRNGTEVQVPTLSQTEVYHAGECSHIGAKYVHLDFVDGDEFSVLLVLPTERNGLDALLDRLTAENLTHIFSHTGHKRVTLQFPKFRLQSESQLNDILRSLGLNQVFAPTADLSGISNETLYVSKAIQKAEILADETGVTASAATGMTFFTMNAKYSPEAETMDFTADHPFLFFIVDRRNHVPLFAGRVTNPSS